MQVAGRELDLDALAAICRRYGIAELAVFGSVARGEERPDSDLDLYYVLAPAPDSAGRSPTSATN